MTSTIMTTTISPELQDINYLANFTNATTLAQSHSTQIANTTSNSDADLDISEITVLCIKSFIFGSIIIGAVLGNALVILAVRRNRKLR